MSEIEGGEAPVVRAGGRLILLSASGLERVSRANGAVDGV